MSQITITQIHTAPQKITITASEYYDLKRKAKSYDQDIDTKRQNAIRLNQSKSPAQRSANARKAAQARWNKRG